MSDSERICTTVQVEVERILNTELVGIKKEIDDLYKTVYKGNGTPSLVTKANSAEQQINQIKENIDDKFAAAHQENSLRFNSLDEKLESKFGRLEGWFESQFKPFEHDIRSTNTLIKDLKDDVDDYRKGEQSGRWHMRAAAMTAIAGVITAAVAIFFNV